MSKKVKLNKEKLARPVKTPAVLQMEAVECGAASLSIILGYYGKFVPLEKLRISCGVSRDGLKATNVLKAAREYGLEAKGYAKSIEKLKQLQMPAIVFWNFNHFLVLEGFTKNKVYLSDPAQGRYHVSYEEFDEAFTGVVLTFKPGESFVKGNEKKGLISSLALRVKNSKMSITYIVLASLFLVIPGLIIPSFTKIFIDKYLVNGISEFIMPLLLVMSGILIINSILVYLQQYYLLRLETKLALTTSSKFLWHVFHLPIAFFTQRYSGEIGSRVSLNDKVAKLLSGDLANAALNAIVVVFYAMLMFSYDAVLTIIGIVMAALNIVALQYISRARKEGNRRFMNENGKLLGTTTSGISMIETLKASGRENDFFTTWTGYLAKVMNAQQELGWLTTRLNIIPPLLMSLTTTVVLGTGAMRVMDGQMTLGMLVAFLYLMSNFMEPVNQLVSVGRLLQETEGDMGRIDDVLNYEVASEFDEKEKKNETSKDQVGLNKLTGHFEMKNVTFGYNTTMPALIENFSLSLKPGSRVALVGGSGSGKSTVARLASGLYEPWKGEIRFDNKLRREIPRAVITESIAVIDQEVLMFKGSIQENISFWDSKIPEKHIIQSARDAAIHDVVAARTNAYDSMVLERGTNFSGGQRQRLEIARALALNPTILIMDEATSALDPKSEKIVMDNIKKRGCTCLIVAHRLSTIIDCDEIIMMEFGKIVERGTHQELLNMNGSYAKLIDSK
ncbi:MULTISPECIES: NHLP family bacteriocin export ABC transporter peptidase/permease/ATPase subunit [unclassified Tenacibaculum]|uniref:NHLP family bacteriocin export ABC transporter peptidase/permease/ATPase subunit n=1 Tax=unclassified Tenacibaculum TaxID=2635139 RepID=UPI001F2811E2|nr:MULTISPECIES: NHLP family bacteriocin export ABC transporter peptidase/permease/ATPase subunit [unclassified Tenacibaculum]MCF2873150.1 NHLP family bacteriocin export ABC transporter peptidase/permease/ATPase subunit [Tenacibaculum sp. Cn5-1]MCF2933306.1 NHLP family bacteriocin export ABC transporter peptidase/permease/ATPase subunit [Tenacibaculum sp. Cn5-34]MCG7510113.1 NHLP family bacteriocin export ABC transporter peptidase/permease/ATPase subunit [Tenacibaculum sp. Cn5-46]